MPRPDEPPRGEEAFVESILDAQPEPPLYFGRMKRLNRDGVPALAALPTPRALWNDETDQVLDSTDASRAEEDPHVLAERRASMQAWVQYARALFSAAEFRFID